MNRREFVGVSASTAAAMSLAIPALGGNATVNRAGGAPAMKVSESIATRTEVAGTRGIVTGGPDSGATTHVVASQARQVPTTSVIAGPPEGPVSPGTRRRTTTRCPTTWGPRPWAGPGAGTQGY